MTDVVLFSIGLVVTLATVAAVLLVGRSEAQDPALNRVERTAPSGGPDKEPA